MMTFEATVALISLALLAGMALGIEAGRRLGLSRIARDPDGLPKGTGAAEGAVFALFGLLLAFTFSGAAGRFEARRDLITQEANAIGTAWLRLDLLPAEAQPPLRDLMRRYLDSRIVTYARAGDEAAAMAEYATSAELQNRLWASALAATQRPDAAAPSTMLLMPALNDVFDIATTRLVAVRSHPPRVVFLLLFAMGVVGALLVGYNGAVNRQRTLFHSTLYAIVMVLAVYVILDLEYPRLGLIRIDDADQLLVDLRASMN
jgi:hypothetical protein